MKQLSIFLVLFCALSAQLVLSGQLSDRMRVKVRQLQSESSIPAPPGQVPIPPPPGAPGSEGGSLSATQLQGSSECGGACSGNIFQWGDRHHHHHHGEQGAFSGMTDVNDDESSSMSIKDALQPIEQWIKAFKKRAKSGGDLTAAAKVIVEPLIDKLKKNQKAAEEKLEESNREILHHVEAQATAHILKMLKAKKIDDDKSEQSASRAAKKEEAREESAEHESMRKFSEAVESAAHELSSPTSSSIVDHVKSELGKL